MGFFLQMGQNQPLPVPVQLILTAAASEGKTAPSLPRLYNQMHLRIMPERLKVPHTLRHVRNGFLIEYAPLIKVHIYAETFGNQPPQNLNLHLAHQPDMEFPALFLSDEVKLRLLLFKFT